MDLGLSGRTYVVTGGTRGLGRAAADALVGEGANVVVCSRSRDHVDEAIGALGERAAGVAVDLRDDDAPARLVAAARESFGGIHGAFVSHGGPSAGRAADLDADTLRDALELATVAPIRLVREVAAVLEPGGAIAVLTSSSSVQPIPGLATSNVARPAVWGYVKTLSDELAGRGVRLNVVVPGRFATDRVVEIETAAAEREGRPLEEVRRETERRIPLARLGDPAELGRVAAFLLSPAASYVTGAAWAVDGGVIRGL